jgi:predicted thioesterase
MKSRPKIGTMGELRFVVMQEHAIDFTTGGMPAVLSTPKLIGLIERTARESLYPFLHENERTVGVEIEIRHLAPTPLGQQVTITTRVIHSEAKLVDFQFEVRDEHEIIARGLHKRAVITVESFARRVAKKSK